MLDGVVAGEITSRKSRTAWKLQPLRNQPKDADVKASLVENGQLPAGQLDLIFEIRWKNRKTVSFLIFSMRSGENEEHGLYRGSAHLVDQNEVFRQNSPHGIQPEKIAGSIIRVLLKPDGSFDSPERLEKFRNAKISLHDLILSLVAASHLSLGAASEFALAQSKACAPQAFSQLMKEPEWLLNRKKYVAAKEANPVRTLRPVRRSIKLPRAGRMLVARRKRIEQRTYHRPRALILPQKIHPLHNHHH